jgi:mRNA-degrading endonuclease RelE of RelBE toxin-antitoxin system
MKLNKFPVEGNRTKLMKKIESLADSEHFIFDHAHLSSLLKSYLIRHPDFRLILGIRDLRATLVSQAYYRSEDIEKFIGSSDMSQKLAYLMSLSEPKGNIAKIYRHAEAIMTLFNLPNVLIVRFEDLVGAKGGGNDDVQRKTIKKIANHIQVPLDPQRLEEIQSILFGNEGISSATFRTGSIDAWRNDFNPELHELFNKNYGTIQLALGYFLDE